MSTPTTNTEQKNEKVSVLPEIKTGRKVTLTVTTQDPSLLEDARKKAIKQIAKEVNIPGFRKGKAPRQVIEKDYPEHIKQDQRKQLADLLLVEALKLTRIPILNQDSPVNFDVKEFSDTQAIFLFSYETEPDLPTIDPKTFQLEPVEEKTITDKELDEAIHQMRFYFADWTPVIDRPVQEDDYVLLDIDSLANEEKPERVFSQTRFQVTLDRMAHWMYHLILGKNTGETVEGISAPNEDAPEEEKQSFEPRKVRVTIFKVEEAKLPEIDEAFAKQIGSTSVEEMRASTQKRLQHDASQAALSAKREQVANFLVKTYPLDLPLSLVEGEFNHRKKQFQENPQTKHQWEKMSQENKEAWEAKTKEDATHAIRLFYLCRKVLFDANLTITHQEIEEEAVSIAARSGQFNLNPENLPKELLSLASSYLCLHKAQDFILEKSAAE